MPLGVGAALLIGSGISALTQVGAAKIGSNASKKAADTQTAAGNKALALNEQIYNQQRQDQNPYMQAGQQGLSNLQQLVGNQQPRFGGGMTPGQGGPAPLNLGNAFGGPQAPPQGAMPAQGGQPMGQPAGAPQQAPMGSQGQPPMMAQAPQSPQGAMVKLRAPDGSVEDVPAQLADQFIQRGAMRVG